ncbi:sugar phosphate nucleotidyltransferase [Natronomonas gomsonensis]|uniref:sugar phosphate nucleotidyltransferase n=1 Tax=Natronomonas gomsonensis TaxID=1046043 RepID=UPI0015BF8F3D|nr:sugar phosphate nucleotidyltransferase [Natronomonas gomsonensis]
MQGVVPAAGRGTRLRPHTDDRPKALVDVGGKPLLAHGFETLAPHVDEFVVVVGYLGDRIREHYGSGYRGTPITYVDQPERDGLADAVLRAEPAVDGPFLQLNGDNVLRGNVGDVARRHRETKADATLLVDRVSPDRARRGGVLELEDDELVGIVEKPDDPPSWLATTGCFAFSERVFDACRAIEPSERGEFELADAIEWLLDYGSRVETVRLDGWRVNVNTAENIERAEASL